jgi:hypothetical protein
MTTITVYEAGHVFDTIMDSQVVLIDGDTTFTIRLGKRAGDIRTRVVRIGDFPANAIEKFLAYGVQRTFNDKIGGSDTDLNMKESDLDDMIAAWKAGDIGRKPREAGDPVEHEARKLIRGKLTKEQRAKLDDKSDDDRDAWYAKTIAENAWVMPQAEKIVADNRAKAQLKVNVDL